MTVKDQPDAPTLPKQERLDWLCGHFARTLYWSRQKKGDGNWRAVRRSYSFSTLDSDFVDAYLDATNAPCQPMILGAHRCRMLAADMLELHKQGVLRKYTLGNEGMGPGWPKWVYNYSLDPGRFDEAERRGEEFKARHP